MCLTHITTREQLHQYLYAAMQLEHATIPPYLTALYSIRPGTNADALPRAAGRPRSRRCCT